MRFAALITSYAPGARFAGAARYGRRPSVPKMSESLAIIH